LLEQYGLGEQVAGGGQQRAQRLVGAGDVGIGAAGGERGQGERPSRVVGPVGRAGGVGVELGQSVLVEPQGGAVQRFDAGGGPLVEPAHELVVVAGIGVGRDASRA